MHLPSFAIVLLLTASIVAAPCLAQPGGAAPEQTPHAQNLAFSEFYVMPVGPRGLQPTNKLLGLRDKRVRLVGYMVHEEEPITGVFMLAPHAVQLAEVADGPADDLPATTVFVHLPSDQQQRLIAYRPGSLELTGTLELGAQAECNQRVSYTRLRLDSPVRQTNPAPLHQGHTHGQSPS